MTTSRSPNLQVPQAVPQPARSGWGGLAFVILLLLLVVNVLSFFVSPRARDSAALFDRQDSERPLEELKKAAGKLEDKNMSAEAADLLEDYLDAARPAAVEAGMIRYRIGKNRQDAGQFERAFAQFLLAEGLLGDSNRDLSHEINRRSLECLRRLGQYADLAREVAERATDTDEDSQLEGQQVVAEAGNEKITVAAFDRLLTNEIELAVRSRLGLSAEEEDALRKKAFEQLASPKARAQQLQEIVATRVLADEARKRKLHEGREFRERLMAVADGILGSTLLYDEVSKQATVTDADVQRFYESNKARYSEAAASHIAHILCKDEADGQGIIRRIDAGESFDDIAKLESLDLGTRDKLGVLTTPVPAEGDQVPLFGANAELHEAIRSAGAGAVLSRPYESDQGWHVIKVASHRERIEQPFEDVKERVRRDTVAARQREVTDQFIGGLFEEYGVKLYPEVFLRGAGAGPDDTAKAP